MNIYSHRDQYIDEVLEAQQRELEELRKTPEEREEEEEARAASRNEEPIKYTFKETLLIVGGAVASGLLIAGILLLGIFLFILFCTQVWLK